MRVGGYLFALLGDHTLGFLPMQFMFWAFVGTVTMLGGKLYREVTNYDHSFS